MSVIKTCLRSILKLQLKVLSSDFVRRTINFDNEFVYVFNDWYCESNRKLSFNIDCLTSILIFSSGLLVSSSFCRLHKKRQILACAWNLTLISKSSRISLVTLMTGLYWLYTSYVQSITSEIMNKKWYALSSRRNGLCNSASELILAIAVHWTLNTFAWQLLWHWWH
jgi:hypothetical protein